MSVPPPQPPENAAEVPVSAASNEAPEQKPLSFADVVRTTMIVKNWLLHTGNQEDVDETASEINTSLVFDPPEVVQMRIDSRSGSFANLDALVNDTSAQSEVVSVELTTFQRCWKRFRDAMLFVIHLPEFLWSCFMSPVDPLSPFFYYWTFVVYIAFLYNSFMIVIFVFDDTDGIFYYYWMALNGLCDLIYLIDIYLNAKLLYLEDGIIVRANKKLLLRYLGTRDFLLDVLSLFPTDLLLLIKKYYCLVRINRLLKLYRVFDFIEKQSIRTNYPNGFRIFHIFIICLVLFHWNSAIFFHISLHSTGINTTKFDAWEFNYVKIADPLLVSCNILLTDEDETCLYRGQLPETGNDTAQIDALMTYWENRHYRIAYSNFTKQYILSMYWSSLTLTTSGQQPYPTRSSHNFLEVFDTIIGMLIFAVIVGSVGNAVATMNRQRTFSQNLMDGMKFYMNYRNVKPVVQKRVMDVLNYNQKYGMIQGEDFVMESLPNRLRGELAIHLHMDNLKRVKLLRDCEANLLYELVLRMQMQMFAPGDLLCRAGELAKELYIVKRGTLELLSESGQVINRLKEGSSFGELAILKIGKSKTANRRKHSLRSVGYSDVYVLRREDALNVLQDYPEQRAKLVEKAKQMIKQRSEADGTILEDILDDSEMGDSKSIEEMLTSMGKILNNLDHEIASMYENFQSNTSGLKQRVSRLENTYYRNHQKIKEFNAERISRLLTI